MAAINITPQQILDAIQHVPEQRWPEVLRAIEDLQSVPTSISAAPGLVRTGVDLRGSDLIGIWSDRADLGDGRRFARQLRESAQQRDREGRPNAAGH